MPNVVSRRAQQIRIGMHVSTAGGLDRAAERAHDLGCAAFQIFTSSPRQWRATAPKAETIEALRHNLARYDLHPLVIHDNYLINLAASDPAILRKSMAAFRGELERAVLIGAEFLVMHPGSVGAGPREQGIARWEKAVRACTEGIAWGGLRLLIENTAGGGGHLGGTFAEVAHLLDRLRGLPVGACLDTCHCWVAGYDLKSPDGYAETMGAIDSEIGLDRIPVWHVNDAKAARGSRLDRHENIGEGQLGSATFRRLLCDPRWRGRAFILETPIDKEGDDRCNVQRLTRLARSLP